jgi:N-acetylmuramoyl-L-alanine amidase
VGQTLSIIMTFLAMPRSHLRLAAAAGLAAVILAGALALPDPVVSGQTTNYTLYTPDGRRTLAVRGGSPETFALDQVAALFGLTFTEDRGAGGLVITTRGQRIVSVPGQSFIQVGGRVVGLDGPIQRERNTWVAPIDFLAKALGPATGQNVVVRRGSRLILVGDVRIPQVSGRVEKIADGVRVILSIQPATPHKVSRDGNRVIVRFDATALDAAPVPGLAGEFATGSRVEGTSLVIELGPATAAYRADAARDALTIDLLSAPPAPTPQPTVQPLPPAPPQIDLAPGQLRTVVIDPGHGGDDAGGKGAGGAVEKDVVLEIARRLKTALESRLGVRVLLTRDGDDGLSIDRRTALANNNKAGLFISLHANTSARPTLAGVQVFSLDLSNYRTQAQALQDSRRVVPLVGGGSRVIDPMPWDLAQIPFADESASFGGLLVQRFAERSVPLAPTPAVLAPLRALVGANMPAVLIELGFLSNADDEKRLGNAEALSNMIEAMVAAVTDARRGLSGEPAGRGGGV